jgi:hypothetical protein
LLVALTEFLISVNPLHTLNTSYHCWFVRQNYKNTASFALHSERDLGTRSQHPSACNQTHSLTIQYFTDILVSKQLSACTGLKTTQRLYRPQNNSEHVQASKQLRACTGLKTTQSMYRPQNNSVLVQASKQLSACTGLKSSFSMYSWSPSCSLPCTFSLKKFYLHDVSYCFRHNLFDYISFPCGSTDLGVPTSPLLEVTKSVYFSYAV